MTVIREKKTGKNQVQHLATREGSTNYLPYQEERRRGTEEARSSKKPHVHKSACLMATYLTCTLHVFTSHVFEFTLHEREAVSTYCRYLVTCDSTMETDALPDRKSVV